MTEPRDIGLKITDVYKKIFLMTTVQEDQACKK